MATQSRIFGLWLALTTILIQLISGGLGEDGIVGFSPEPQDVIAVRNKPLLINCVVFGMKPGRITWHKNGVLIDDSRRFVTENGSLYFKKVIHKPSRNRTDEGIYMCNAKDTFGTLSSRPIKLTVAGIPRISEGPRNVTARVGETVRFSCKTSAISPVIVWEKNRQKLPQNERTSVLDNLGVIHISNVQLTDQGKYRCKVVNVVATRSSTDAQLTVLEDKTQIEPYFLATPKSVVRCVGETAILECAVGGRPAQGVTWSRQDGRMIAGIRYSTIGGNSLKIDNIQLSDNGTYICSMRSDPTKKAVATLIVQSPPNITISSSSLIKPAFLTLRLSCVFSGVPRPNITWYKNGQPIVESIKQGHVTTIEEKNESVWVLVSGKPENTGYYQCRAQNSAGFDQAIARVHIWQSVHAPDPPTRVQAFVNGSTKVLLKWSPASEKNGIKILAYTVHYFTTDGLNTHEQVVQDTEYLVNGLHPFTKYTFYLTSFNKAGGSLNTSKHVTVTTAEGVPTAAPEVELETMSATSIKVTWKPLPLNMAQGNVVKYNIIYKEDGSSYEYKKSVNSAIKDYTLTDLKPSTLYHVRVLAGTKAGLPKLDDANWPWVRAQTLPGDLVNVPSSPRLQLKVINETALLVNWQPSPYDILPVTAFLLKYRRNDQTGNQVSHKVALNATDRSHLITGLQPLSWYEVTLLALNENGEGHSGMETIKMEVGAVSGSNGVLPPAPRDVQAEPVNEASIRVEWLRPPKMSDIISYTIKYLPVNEDGKGSAHIKYVTSEKEEVVISGLQPFTNYVFAVQTNTEEHSGPFSYEIYCRTSEGIPSAPQNALVKLLTPRTAELSWSPPANTNGIIVYYMIRYTAEDVRMLPSMQWMKRQENGSVTVAEFDNLQEDHVYNFKIQAATHAGLGAETRVMQIRTKQMPVYEDGGEVEASVQVDLGVAVGVAASLVCIVCIIVIIIMCRRYTGSLSIQEQRSDCMVAERLANQDPCLPNGNSHVTMVHLTCDHQVATFIPQRSVSDNASAGYISMQHLNGVVDGGGRSVKGEKCAPQQHAKLHTKYEESDNPSKPITKDLSKCSLNIDRSPGDYDDYQENHVESPLLYSNSNNTSSDNTLESSLETSRPPTSENSIQGSVDSPQDNMTGGEENLSPDAAHTNHQQETLLCCHDNMVDHNRQPTSCVPANPCLARASTATHVVNGDKSVSSSNTSLRPHNGYHDDQLSNLQSDSCCHHPPHNSRHHNSSHNSLVSLETQNRTQGCTCDPVRKQHSDSEDQIVTPAMPSLKHIQQQQDTEAQQLLQQTGDRESCHRGAPVV